MKPFSVIIVGAGSRGWAYATHMEKFPDMVRIVGVADTSEFSRNRVAAAFSIPPENVFAHWQEVAARPRLADAVVIATQDEMHLEPAIRFADQGYHILLEKPMAPRMYDCQHIVEAATRNSITFAVCHVMRYTPYTRKLKQLLDEQVIGDIASIQLLEPVGYWHQAHSYVRGNWRREDQSSPMLLAKSCHDLDWIRYLIGQSCTHISSFGSLKHFRRDQRPNGAGDRCLACDIEPDCPYSARKIYIERYNAGVREWPLTAVAPDLNMESLVSALEDGPYGRCVYGCDNDVVDHQVVNMQFSGGETATFTMTGFSKYAHRQTRIFGTRGTIEGDGENLKIFDFLTDETTEIYTGTTDPAIVGGHSGGDYGLTAAFVKAIATGDPSTILSGPGEALESHLMVFAAEAARKSGTVIAMDDFLSQFTTANTPDNSSLETCSKAD